MPPSFFSRISHSPLNASAHTSANPPQLLRTPYYDFHRCLPNSPKLVNFAGWEMPLSYSNSGGQVSEHLAVRSTCGLFDVSHMLQSKITGRLAQKFCSILFPNSFSSLKPYHSSLSLILNHQGKILDDAIITKWSNDHEFYLVTNAARRHQDLIWIQNLIQTLSSPSSSKVGLDHHDLAQFHNCTEQDLKFQTLDHWGLLALQGPKSSQVLQQLLAHRSQINLDQVLFFGQSLHTTLQGGIPVHIARTGYTGEDGFEISIDPNHARQVGQLLIEHPLVNWVGLAARDSLRIEAGMCLYGQDLDDSITPREAGLSWVIGKDRTGYIGDVSSKSNQPPPPIQRRRVGLIIENGPPGRSGCQILDQDGSIQLGSITSGIPSPSLSNQNIAMGYVQSGFHSIGTQLKVLVRNKLRNAQVVKMPFVPHKFHKRKD